MSGHPPSRGRPSKTDGLEFQLLALAAYARRLSQEGIAMRINDMLDSESVSQPTVGKWVRDTLPTLASPSITIRRPDSVGLRAVCLLFRRKPAYALKLAKILALEPKVSRVEQWRGEMNVFAEVIARDTSDIDDIVERYEPDLLYEVVERVDAVANALEHLGRPSS